MKFKVGDRVRAIGKVDGQDLKGKCGTVIQIEHPLNCWSIGVEFDEHIDGHDCNKRGKYGYCRWGKMSEFEPISNTNQKIVITTDGKETLARLYEDNKVVKTATAKCSPEDTFDFTTGANLAYERLMEGESHNEEWRKVNRPAKAGDYILEGISIEAVKLANPKYFKGKAVCIESNICGVVVGKIYDFSKNDGRGESDRKLPILTHPRKTVDEINETSFLGKFLEIKE